MSLPRYHRLRKRQDFSLVYQKGTRFSSAHLTLRALAVNLGDQAPPPLNQTTTTANRQPDTQVGISISQKVSKRSVVRNRIKRQIKAVIRQLLPEFAVGWRLVIVVHPNARGCEYVHFLQELEQLLVSAEVIDGHTGRCVF